MSSIEMCPPDRGWGSRITLGRSHLIQGERAMADLRTGFCGIKSPNPFWLASAPPTDKEYNVVRAYKAGWGGVVWKTLGEDPHIVSGRCGPRQAGTGRWPRPARPLR